MEQRPPSYGQQSIQSLLSSGGQWAYLGRECDRDMAVVEEIWAGGVELEG